MPSSGEGHGLWEREIPIPVWMTAALILLAAIGLVSIVLFLSRLLANALNRRR